MMDDKEKDKKSEEQEAVDSENSGIEEVEEVEEEEEHLTGEVDEGDEIPDLEATGEVIPPDDIETSDEEQLQRRHDIEELLEKKRIKDELDYLEEKPISEDEFDKEIDED